MRGLGPGAHSLGAIAAQADLPLATAHRYVQALVTERALTRRGPRGRYALAEAPYVPFEPGRESAEAPTSLGSMAVRNELVALQSHTGHIAVAYVPLLIGRPMRVHAEQALGTHGRSLNAAPRAALDALWRAPLETDASGWVILANLGDHAAGQPQLARIRDRGHAIGSTPLFGHDAVAAPLWRGRTVAGSVTLLVRHTDLHSDVVRARLAGVVMDTAARLSGYLTHPRPSSSTTSSVL